MFSRRLPVPGNPEFTPGSRIIYNDGRPGHTDVVATVLDVDSAQMIVQFEDRADTTRIAFSDHHWMVHITIAL
jgi:hypothetical protein